MQSFIVASLVSELAGGVKNDPPPLVLNVTKKHLGPLRVNLCCLFRFVEDFKWKYFLNWMM